MSSLELSKSLNYDSIKHIEPDSCQYMYSNIFLSNSEDAKKPDMEDLDEEYNDISIPFECSIPHKELEAFLRETHKQDYNEEEYMRHFETFSPNTKALM